MTQSPAAPKRSTRNAQGGPPSLPPPKARRRLREAKSLSQAELAAKIGVTRETVRSWESGRTAPRGRRLKIYTRLLAEMANEQAVADTRPGRRNGWAKHLAPAAEATDTADTAKSRKSPARIPVGAAMNGLPTRPLTTTEAADPKPELELERPAAATPAEAFDALCATCSPGLVRQTYLLTGRRILAQESVERAFQLAWQRWPEVAVDRDPAGWVRAAAYEYAMSPWHRLRPALRQSDAPPAAPADRAFLDVLLSLPPAQRRTLLLYDGIGLDLPETAAETEASTPATANRLLNAREAVAERLPEQAATPDDLHRRLAELCAAEKLRAPNAGRVRTGSEHRARFWTRTAIAFTALIVGATALTLRTAPTRYEPPQAPGKAISGVPPRMGPGPLTYTDQLLHRKLREDLRSGPERLTPQAR
ncbi:helix-turn-helix domain-containing protein [Streptomyces sp. NPDC048436]|uniref:helix-turn-helix domain-containing protein n=1 Tax=Streptomyces sp. NPDC048436 TaxID=3365550 RepID=UPI003710AD5B